MSTRASQQNLPRWYPVCPRCDYDLSATVADALRRCPECGERFRMDELEHRRRPRKGEWTVGRGLRRMGGALVWRSLIGTVLLAGLVWVMSPMLAEMSARGLGAALLLPGLMFGYFMARKLTEVAGCVSRLITVAGIIAVVATAFAGAGLAGLSRPLPGGDPVAVPLVLSLIGAGVMVHLTWWEA